MSATWAARRPGFARVAAIRPLPELSAMAGSTAFAGGELYLRAGVNSLSVMSLTEADLAVIVRDRGA